MHPLPQTRRATARWEAQTRAIAVSHVAHGVRTGLSRDARNFLNFRLPGAAV